MAAEKGPAPNGVPKIMSTHLSGAIAQHCCRMFSGGAASAQCCDSAWDSRVQQQVQSRTQPLKTLQSFFNPPSQNSRRDGSKLTLGTIKIEQFLIHPDILRHFCTTVDRTFLIHLKSNRHFFDNLLVFFLLKQN
jgi:hypothetical protein